MQTAGDSLPRSYDFSFHILSIAERLTGQWRPDMPDIPLKKTEVKPAAAAAYNWIQPYFDYDMAGQVSALINLYRQQHGLGGLAGNSSLASAAAVRAQEIVYLYSHTRPNGTAFHTAIPGITAFSTVGENLCQGYSTAEDIMAAFMNSEAHRDNILGDFSHVGVSVYRAGNGRYYCGQTFGMERATEGAVAAPQGSDVPAESPPET